jgi:hypothetical protein
VRSKRPSLIGSTAAALGTLLLASSCAQHAKVVAPEIVSERLKFLRDGETTQREVLDRLGDPSHFFERDHVVVYLMHEDYYGRLSVGPGNVKENDPLYHLVIQFTSDGAMERHSLIRLQ